ncbi:MAG: amidohydrolase family protein, partial [Woeseiaceae bacterium]
MTKPTRSFLFAVAFVCASPAYADDIAVRAGMLYPVSSAPIENGIVIVRDGKISEVGSAASIEIPDGMQVLEAAVVTPGLVDAHSVVGLAGYLNHSSDQDQLERSEALQPELRAIDAYNAREPLIEWVRGYGVTTVHTGHGPGEIIAG